MLFHEISRECNSAVEIGACYNSKLDVVCYYIIEDRYQQRGQFQHARLCLLLRYDPCRLSGRLKIGLRFQKPKLPVDGRLGINHHNRVDRKE